MSPEDAVNGPVSWRDIYRAVAESEVRIVAAINAAVTPLNASAIDHEARLRNLETFGPAALIEMKRDRDENIVAMRAARAAMEVRITALEQAERVVEARQSGILATLSAGQKTILLLASIVGMAVAIVEVTSHLVGGS